MFVPHIYLLEFILIQDYLKDTFPVAMLHMYMYRFIFIRIEQEEKTEVFVYCWNFDYVMFLYVSN